MKQTLKPLFILIILIFFGCSEQKITIKKDGMAIVKMKVLTSATKDNDSMPSSVLQESSNDSVNFEQVTLDFYNQTGVKKLKVVDGQETEIMFQTENIDSLGYFLDPVFGLTAQTKLTNDYFEIIGSDGQMDPEEDIGGWTNGFEYKLNLVFEKSIKKMETENDYIKQLDSHNILIETSIGQMNFYGQENKLKVIFE